MPGLFSWYNNQYSSWNRMRRMQAPQFVARVDSRPSRNATAMHNGAELPEIPNNDNANANSNGAAGTGDVVINMGDLSINSPFPINKDNKDTLFGPSIGVVSTAPEWCAEDGTLDEKVYRSEKELDEKGDDDNEVDELTPEIVKEWIKRSKEPSEPTTTLQALVNLKRPSIRLSPLAESVSDPSASSPDQSTDALGKHHQQHGLEFEYDCDAPQCLISLHVVGVPASLGESDEHPEHTQANGHGKDNERLVLFEMTSPGGFGRKLTLADGAVLELAKLEAAAKAHRAQLAAAAAAANGSNNASNAELANANATGALHNKESHDHHRRKLTFFKKRNHNSRTASPGAPDQASAATPPTAAGAVTAGPALAVVDAEAPHLHPNPSLNAQGQTALATFFAGGDAERARRKKEADEEGVRVAIRLTARDGESRPLKVRNEQVTYLHIIRHGPLASSSTTSAGVASTSDSSIGASADGQQEMTADGSGNTPETTKKEEEEKEDTRPWVVRVVKREARIGAHSFQLHEIYGLTAHASVHHDHVTPSSPPPPTSPTTTDQQHTYPPTPGQPQINSLSGAAGETEDSPAECLLCLSSPREVVLLPCRHLVACRECAVNMVEFGAGGTVVQPAAEPEPSGAAANGDNAEGGAGTGGQGESNNAPPAPVPTVTTTRRKRKAKGWFCPVCRQPYTSLLRITTTPPPFKGLGLPHGTGDIPASGGDAKRVSVTSSLDGEAETSPQQHDASSPPAMTEAAHPLSSVVESADNDGSNGNARPGFFRHFSGRARERDLERGAAGAGAATATAS